MSDEIEDRGGRVVRVLLDYEMKRELYARLARAAADKPPNPRTGLRPMRGTEAEDSSGKERGGNEEPGGGGRKCGND